MTFEQDVDKAIAQLTRLDQVIQSNLQPAARAAAGTFKAEAIRRAPVRTGKLKRSFGDRPGEAKDKTAVHSGVHVVFNRAFYAIPVEYGRRGGKGKRPFMRPAAAAARGDMIKAMETTISRAVDRTL